jgi:hypothetical protein
MRRAPSENPRGQPYDAFRILNSFGSPFADILRRASPVLTGVELQPSIGCGKRRILSRTLELMRKAVTRHQLCLKEVMRGEEDRGAIFGKGAL